MGNLVIFLPIIYIAIIIGSLAILGFPFLSGFYSKDLILELVYSRYLIESIFIYFFAVLAAVFTSIYSFKLLFYIFLINTYNYNYINIVF
jgi:NADH-ubiquinone oxidoreductase chain 5